MNLFIACLGILFIISAFISIHPFNKYSIYTKTLKFFPRLVLGIALLSSIICLCETTIGIILGFSFIFMFSEVVVQLLNLKYGRH